MADAATIAAVASSAAQGLGSILGGGSGGGSQPTSSTWIGSYPQMQLYERLIAAAMQGRGEYGFGPAAQSGMATLRQQMANRGIGQTSGVYNSALANMLSQATAADAQGRRDFGLTATTMQPWTVTANKLGNPGYWTWGGDQSYAQRIGGSGGMTVRDLPGPMRANTSGLYRGA